MLGRFLTGAVLVAGLLAACGGAKETGLFGGDNTGGGEDDSGATVDSSTHVDSGSGGHDSSTTIDSGNPEKDAGNPQKDTGPPPPAHVVHCENADCAVPSQVCCRTGVTSNYTFMCTAPNACVSSGTDIALAIPCDDGKDCPGGNVCCVTASQTGGAADVSCRPANECTSALGRTLVCDPNVDTCPNGQQCRPSTATLPGYNICR